MRVKLRDHEAKIAARVRHRQALGKTPVVVKDVSGFLINRILMSLCDEALRLDREGGTGDDFPRWEVLNNRGVAKLGKADYEGALGDFDAAIQEQPDYIFRKCVEQFAPEKLE